MAKTTRVRVIYNKFPEIVRKMPDAAMDIVADTLADIDRYVQVGMSAGGSGRTYTRGGRSHRASSPGAMPAKDTAALAGSMQHEIARGQYAGYYYTTSDYAPHLEYGTSKMAPRPFLTPSAERARPKFISSLRKLEDRLR